MHKTAMDFGKRFFETYINPLGSENQLTIVDIGSLDVNGSLRRVAPAEHKYIGVDFATGNGVDVVLEDPYTLPFESESIDACVCSSCLEHSEFFWLLFNEIMRILKPTGVLYLLVPSNGDFHRYPVDCWRFYPDSGKALENWGRRSGYTPKLLESFIGDQRGGQWNDLIATFVKDESNASLYPNRIQDTFPHYTNGLRLGNDELSKFSVKTEDQRSTPRLIRTLKKIKNKATFAQTTQKAS